MKRITSSLLLLTFVLGACASSPVATEASPTEPAAAAESTLTENSTQASAGREAVVSEFEGQVTFRSGSDEEFVSVEIGITLHPGNALQTGKDGRARLDLLPDGTIVRIAPNSAFALSELSDGNGEPKSSISLFFGKIFVLLNGGSIDVQTPSGVASVRGSLMSVSYNPETGRVQAACLEGHCSMVNKEGAETDIPEGETGYIEEDGEINLIDGIDQSEVEDWINEAGSEVEEFLGELPNPEEYPDIEEYEEFEFDPSNYYEQEFTGDGEGLYQPEDSPSDDPSDDATEDPPVDDPTEEP